MSDLNPQFRPLTFPRPEAGPPASQVAPFGHGHAEHHADHRAANHAVPDCDGSPVQAEASSTPAAATPSSDARARRREARGAVSAARIVDPIFVFRPRTAPPLVVPVDQALSVISVWRRCRPAGYSTGRPACCHALRPPATEAAFL